MSPQQQRTAAIPGPSPVPAAWEFGIVEGPVPQMFTRISTATGVFIVFNTLDSMQGVIDAAASVIARAKLGLILPPGVNHGPNHVINGVDHSEGD